MVKGKTYRCRVDPRCGTEVFASVDKNNTCHNLLGVLHSGERLEIIGRKKYYHPFACSDDYVLANTRFGRGYVGMSLLERVK